MSLCRRAIALALLLSCAVAFASAPAVATAAKDEWLGPNAWGSVAGRVYDAATGAPVEAAQVVIYQDGAFARKGRTVGQTTANGEYKCQAMLGRVSSNLQGDAVAANLLASVLMTAVGAAAGMGPTIVTGGEMKETVRMDFTRLTIRVRQSGYRPFEGQVLCREVDPEAYGVRMEPILLVPSASPYVSYTGQEWSALRIADVSVAPPLVLTGGKAVVTVRVREGLAQGAEAVSAGPLLWAALGGDGKRKPGITVQAVSSLWGRKPITLKAKEQNGREVVLTGEFTAPARSEPAIYSVGARVHRSKLEVARSEQSVPAWVEGDASKRLLSAFNEAGQQRNVAVLDVIGKSSDQAAAEQRLEAFRLQAAGLTAEALGRLQQVCALPEARRDDFVLLGVASEQAKDYAGAVAAWQRALDLTPVKGRLWVLARGVEALARSGKSQEALALGLPPMQKVQRKNQPWKLPVELAVAIDRAYLALGQPEAATYTDYFVQRRSELGKEDPARGFLREWQLVLENKALETTPGDAQLWAKHGYALGERGEWEAAVAPLRKALELDPTLGQAQSYLGFALARTGQTEPEAGLEAAALAFQVPEKRKKLRETQDFIAAHVYGITLCRVARQQRLAGDPASEKTLLRGRQLLGRAVECGRGEANDPGAGPYLHYQSTSPVFASTYTGDSLVFVHISGFAFPEAENDLAILTSYRALDADQANSVTWLDLARAYAELNRPELAEEALAKVRELSYSNVDMDYVAAVIALARNDREAAGVALQAVLAKHPSHPRANLELASLDLAAGDPVSAAACLQAHAAQVYGETTMAQPDQVGQAAQPSSSPAPAQTEARSGAVESLAASVESYRERRPVLGSRYLERALVQLADLTSAEAPHPETATGTESAAGEDKAIPATFTPAESGSGEAESEAAVPSLSPSTQEAAGPAAEVSEAAPVPQPEEPKVAPPSPEPAVAPAPPATLPTPPRGSQPERPEPARAAPAARTSEPPADARPGDTWISPKDGGEMVYVPAGEFLMGKQDGPNPTRRSVHGDAFWIDRYEVTVAQYRAFCEATGKPMPQAPQPNWTWDPNHPIVCVSWQDAADYAAWAGKRLPTEAEWEKAARGTDGRAYPWGDAWAPGSSVAPSGPRRRPSTVGSCPADVSPYGAMDMAGNVREWCGDSLDGERPGGSSTKSSAAAPPSRRVVKGAWWERRDPQDYRCSRRDTNAADSPRHWIGFRCVRGPQ